MNSIRIKVYEKVRKDICEKHDGAEDFINETIEDGISVLVSFFRVRFLVSFF